MNDQTKNSFHFFALCVCGAALFLFTVIYITYECTRAYVEGEVRVIYNLDKKENDQDIVQVIEEAQHYIYFAIYTFTEADIATALVKARERGLTVVGVMDASQTTEVKAQASIFAKLQKAGVAVTTSTNPQGIMHAKIIATDSAYAFGSYNWTASATLYNDEVLEIGTDDLVRLKFVDLVKKVLKHNQ